MCITHDNQTNQMFPNKCLPINNNIDTTTTTTNETKPPDDKPQDQLTENSMAVLPSSISKLRKRGMFNRTNSGRRNSAGTAAAAEDEETRYHSEVEDNDVDDDDDDTESPPEPLPLYQQRENYFT